MSSTVIQPAPVKKSIVVKADAARAFSAFTGGIGRWWPRSKSIGSTAQADVVLEARGGGRWYERGLDGAETEWGKVLLWEPPVRIVLAWQIAGNWKYDPALVTEVEVNFIALGVAETRVEIEHRNLERFGDRAAAVRAAFDSDNGWSGVLKAFEGMLPGL